MGRPAPSPGIVTGQVMTVRPRNPQSNLQEPSRHSMTLGRRHWRDPWTAEMICCLLEFRCFNIYHYLGPATYDPGDYGEAYLIS